MSTSKPLTSTSRSFWLIPTRVPLTDTWVPSARVPRIVIRLRWSGLSASVTRRTAVPRSAASSGAFT